MDNPSDQTPRPSPEVRRTSRSAFLYFAALALVLVGILAYLMLMRLDRISRKVDRLSAQVEQSHQQSEAASEKAASALLRATQAAQSAQTAAQQRNQAEKAKAASEVKAKQALQQAQQAQQQTQAAQHEAAAAQAKAEKYRKEREAELEHLQKVLGQIANTRRTAMGLVMTLGSKSIRFAFDQSSLRPEDKEVLSRIAGVLSTLKGYQIYVYGYTDHIGTKQYNLALSRRRAKTVRDYLVQNGIDPGIISTKGFGESDPLVPGTTPQARAINRRVEIGLVDSTIKPVPSQNPGNGSAP